MFINIINRRKPQQFTKQEKNCQTLYLAFSSVYDFKILTNIKVKKMKILNSNRV